MKFYAASVPRSVRAARLAHLPLNSFLGSWHTPNAGGGFQVFDVLLQKEADFLRSKNYLASPTMGAALQQGAVNAPYVLKDIKQLEVPDDAADPHQMAGAYFRPLFNIPEA